MQWNYGTSLGPVVRDWDWPQPLKLAGAILLGLSTCAALAQEISPVETAAAAAQLKSLPLEELFELEVTSASRRPQKFTEIASAIDVITQEEIERSGAVTLMDALRIVTGLHVAQEGGHTWAISARGFNITSANKLQVMQDGRSLYSPLFSGVFWDVQDTFLEDVDRIEVIRGPGAAQWGANAVNGVINIVTKSAKQTQGTLLYGGAGSEERAFAGLRYGGQLGKDTYYRAYVKYFDRDSLASPNGDDGDDDWQMGRTGFRVDSDLTEENLLTVQGDMYYGRLDDRTVEDNEVSGGNFLGRWTRTFSEESSLQLQAYYDRTVRRVPSTFAEKRDTFDVDLQHRFPIGGRHDVVWGLNYRVSFDEIKNSPILAFLPDDRAIQLFSGFVQDTIALVHDRLQLTLGSKLEYYTMGGTEVQPTVRLAWTPSSQHTVWGAISRAVRAPTRLDEDFVFRPTPGVVAFAGSGSFDSEKVLAYELGYRVQPVEKLSLDLATFYNVYEDLRSQEPTPPAGIPIVLENRLDATTYGAEFAVRYQFSDWWKIKGSYTYLIKDLDLEDSSSDASGGSGEGNDPRHLFSFYSFIDVGEHVRFDQVLRYVDALPNPRVANYLVMDLRLAWSPLHNLELSIVGRNLLDNQHPEFGSVAARREVEHSVFGKVSWRF